MINESQYWKEELFRNARWLVDSLNKKRWTERSFSKLEKSVMISAYAIRKLNEASKVPPEYMEKTISVGLFSRNKTVMDKLNNHDIQKHYNLADSIKTSLKIRELFNQIIHSYIFCPVFEGSNKLIGILINSDNTRNKGVYYLEVKKLINLIMYISSGDIVSLSCIQINGEFVTSEVVYKSSVDLESID